MGKLKQDIALSADALCCVYLQQWRQKDKSETANTATHNMSDDEGVETCSHVKAITEAQ